MVSRFRYLSFKDFNLEPPHPVRVPAARAARLRDRRLEPAGDAVRTVRALRRCRARPCWLWRRLLRLRRAAAIGRRPTAGVTGSRPMNDGRRLAYLEALGVDVYVRRSLPPAVGSGRAACGCRSRPVAAASAGSPAAESSLDWDALRADGGRLHALRPQRDAHADRVRRGRPAGALDGDRRGAGRRGRPAGRALRRARAGSCSTRCCVAIGFARERRLHRQRAQVPTARQPRPASPTRWRTAAATSSGRSSCVVAGAHDRGRAHRGAEPARDRRADRRAARPGARARPRALAAGRDLPSGLPAAQPRRRSARPGRT